MNRIFQNATPFINDTSTIICASCGREGHSRRTHSRCPMNPNNTNRAVSVTCRFCGREGHTRRSHSNCRMNLALQGETANLNCARDPALPEVPRNSVGEMEVVCSSCGAYMWISERKSNSNMLIPKFQICCAAGQAILKPLEPLPEVIVNLIKNNDAQSKEFKKNIRTYNSALSFTSTNANLDGRYANDQHGAYAFRIHGSVHHLMSSSLMPHENDDFIQQPKFAQIYIFDSENELQNRMNVAGNSNIEPRTLSVLQEMMHSVNPFIGLFKTMKELSSEQEGSINDIRMIFRAESPPDSRRYNNPTADKIGVLIVGGDDEGSIEPTNRDIVLRLRGTGSALERINELHQHYDPLQYVLTFPFGDP